MSRDAIERIMQKLECLEHKLDEHVTSSGDFRNETKAFMESLMPVKDGLAAFQSVIRFLKFIGVPTTIVFATIYWLIRRL